MKRKIGELEQNEEAICTISKDSNHINNQYLANQKETTNILFQLNDEHGKRFFTVDKIEEKLDNPSWIK